MSVTVTARIGKGNFEIIKELTTDGVRMAIEKTKTEAIAYEQGGSSPVPIDTGLLRSSFMISIVSQTIAMKWSAIKPGTTFDYAHVQDKGSAHIQGKNYSEKMKEWVKQRLHANLIQVLQATFAGVTL